MTATPTAESPVRPNLTATDCRPDVLLRLREAADRGGKLALRIGVERGDIFDAIDAIAGLRDCNVTRLRLINEAKDELDQARARIAEMEAELAGMRSAMTEGR